VNYTNQNSKYRNEANSQTEFTSIKSVPTVDHEPPEIKIKPPVFSVNLYPSVWLALSAMSLVGIIAVVLHFIINKAEEPVQLLTAKIAEPKVEIPKTAEAKKKVIKNSVFVNNLEQIAKNCSRMVTPQQSFAVFEHGTCVLLLEPVEDHVVSARSTLKILADPKTEFEVENLDNNNYLIIFDRYLFCWMFADQLAKNKDALMQDKRLNRSPNDSPKLRTLTDIELRVGKLARLCLLEDSKKLNIKKIVKAKVPTLMEPAITAESSEE